MSLPGEWTEDDYDAMSEGDCCHHGIGFDEECEECEEEETLACSICSCLIGDEVGYGDTHGIGRMVCENCCNPEIE